MGKGSTSYFEYFKKSKHRDKIRSTTHKHAGRPIDKDQGRHNQLDHSPKNRQMGVADIKRKKKRRGGSQASQTLS